MNSNRTNLHPVVFVCLFFVLFAKMDQVFSLKKKTLKKYWKSKKKKKTNKKKTLEKSEFVGPEKWEP